MDEDRLNIHDTKPVYETLQKLKDGTLDPRVLSRQTVYLCIEVLLLEGYQVSAIANLLKRSDRTIHRYVSDIREINALEASPDLTRVLVGEFLLNARNQYSRLKQIARLKEASFNDKAKTEFLAWRVFKELIDTLYYVGFLAGVSVRSELDSKEKKGLPQNAEEPETLQLFGPDASKKKIEEIAKAIMEDLNRLDSQDADEKTGEGKSGTEAI